MPRNRAFTVHVGPTGAPIPVRSCDWMAAVDGEEETTTCTGETPWGVLRAVADDLEAEADATN